MPVTFGSVEHRGEWLIVNVSRNGKPFGQLWTWKNIATEKHPWHAKPLNGGHAMFEKLDDAKEYMKSCCL